MPHGSLAFVLAACFVVPHSVAQTPASVPAADAAATPAQQLEQLREATSLYGKDAKPFHLKIEAQFFDLYGKPSGTGTVEEWWVSRDESRTEYTIGQTHWVHGTGLPDQTAPDTRERYLLSRLLEVAAAPAAEISKASMVVEFNRKFGKVQLSCLEIRDSANKGSPPRMLDTYCSEPNTTALRVITRTTEEEAARNAVGKLRGINVALALQVAYEGRQAVTGKVTALQLFDPTDPGAPELHQRTASADVSAEVSEPPGVVSGSNLIKTFPIYPASAKQRLISGTVLLHAVITPEGKVSSLIPLASPDDSLTQAALDAVRKWTYRRFLLDGKPTAVDTTITVHFNLERIG